jgi:hypothetical protein
MQGALRREPMVRLGIGLVLGLLVGWVLSTPYARRAERQIGELRAEANRERYRPLPEARAHVAELDARADADATRAALGAMALWLAVGGATVAAWYRLT